MLIKFRHLLLRKHSSTIATAQTCVAEAFFSLLHFHFHIYQTHRLSHVMHGITIALQIGMMTVVVLLFILLYPQQNSTISFKDADLYLVVAGTTGEQVIFGLVLLY